MHTSTFPLMAASCSGVKFQLSLALGSLPLARRMVTTSVWPNEQALWRGIRPPRVREREGRGGGGGGGGGGKIYIIEREREDIALINYAHTSELERNV